MQARIDGPSVRLMTRKALDWTERFASVAAAVEKISLASGLLDGEVVVEDGSGITSFNNLQADLKAAGKTGSATSCSTFSIARASI